MKLENLGKVVFYQSADGTQVAHVFYTDGKHNEVSLEEGFDALRAIAKEENISNFDELESFYDKEDSRIRTFSSEALYEAALPSLKYTHEFTNDELSASLFNNSKIPVNKVSLKNISNDKLNEDDYEDSESLIEDEEEILKEEGYTSDKESTSMISNIKKKIKNSNLAKKLTAFTLAFAMCLGIYSVANRKSKSGDILNNNIDYSATQTLDDVGVEDFSDVSDFNSLLNKTTNTYQHDAMKLMSDNLDYFNITFANHYLENGKNIRAALSWDEMMALQIAYNNYSKEEIKAIFNGYELQKDKFDAYYKNASLQLMGAYVLESREMQVNSWKYVNSVEGQEFVKKYNEMFLAAKEATGSQKVELVNKFYQELYKDFPICEEVREVGISHADSRSQLEQYKLAVAPIVSASEILFQNLEVDHTLSDKAVEYFNDLGLCNIGVDQFERVQTILLGAEEYSYEAKYEQFRELKIKELTAKGYYVIDDAHRNLNQLDKFKSIVNLQRECFDNVNSSSSSSYSSSSNNKSKHYSNNSNNNNSSNSSSSSNTTYRTETSTSTTDSRSEAINKAGQSKVEEAENSVNVIIEIENNNNKTQAEIDAEKTRQEMQKEADEQAKINEKIVEEDEKDLQNKIDKVNENINNGKSQNESDFGDHNVKIDKEYKDENGNIDKSVENITTDGTGAKTNNDLPNPNKTGKDFDKNAPTGDNNPANPVIVEPDYNVEDDEECIDYINNNNKTEENKTENTSSTTEENKTENSSTTTETKSEEHEENFYTEEVTTETTTTTTTTTTVETTTEEVVEDTGKKSDINNEEKSSSSTSTKETTSNNVEVSTPTVDTKTTNTSTQHIVEYEVPTKTAEEIVDEYISSIEMPTFEETSKTLTK